MLQLLIVKMFIVDHGMTNYYIRKPCIVVIVILG